MGHSRRRRGSGFRRYTFDHHSKIDPPNHFGQLAVVLAQISPDAQLRSRRAQVSFVPSRKNEASPKFTRRRQPRTAAATKSDASGCAD